MHHISRLIRRSIDVTKHLHTIHGVDIDIDLEKLAESLQMLGTTPFAILAGACHHFFEAPLLVLQGRSRHGGRTRRIHGRRGSFRPAPLTTFGDDKLHEIVLVASDVVGQKLAERVGMGEVGIQLVGQGIVQAIAYP